MITSSTLVGVTYWALDDRFIKDGCCVIKSIETDIYLNRL